MAHNTDQSSTFGSSRQKFSALAYKLSLTLIVVSIIGSAASFFAPDILHGPAVMIGSGQGTALIILVVAVPTLAISTFLAKQDWGWAQVVSLGSISYILYNSVVLLFALPFNSIFLAYVAMLSLSFWSAIALILGFETSIFSIDNAKASLRAVSIYLLIVTALFYFLELNQYIPATLSNVAPASFVGTGLLNNPSHILDLAFALPLAVISAVWMWQRKTWGNIIGGGLLIMFTIESASIASDQFFGNLADPNSSVVSLAVVPIFAVLTIVGLVFTFLYFNTFGKIKGNIGQLG